MSFNPPEMVSYFCSISGGGSDELSFRLAQMHILDQQKGTQPPTTTKKPQKFGKRTGSIAVSGSLNR